MSFYYRRDSCTILHSSIVWDNDDLYDMVMKLHNYRLSDVTTYETLTADRAYGKAIDIPLRMTNVTTLDEKAVFVAYKNSKTSMNSIPVLSLSVI